MRLQRLNPATDEALYRQLYEWNEQTPGSYRASDDAWGEDSWEEFYERANRTDLIDCAVYNAADELEGSITVLQVAPKVWETFVIGRRGSDAECLTMACFAMARELMAAGIAEVFTSWVWEKNRGALKLNRNAGMQETGVGLYKGAYKGRPLKFLQLAMDRARMEALHNGEIETKNHATV